jgi:adenylosuccinate synthase
MAVDVVLGLQRGDEGKGRFVDLLAAQYEMVARFNGGPNAGHTIADDNLELRLHQIPSGITSPGVTNIIGNGSYVDPIKLIAELDEVGQHIKVTPKQLLISADAHLILPHHISLDEIREAGKQGQGSTLSGIAYVAADKYARIGVRAEELLSDLSALEQVVIERLEATQTSRQAAGLPVQNSAEVAKKWIKTAETLKPFIGDTLPALHEALQQQKKILAEGAQATGLDIEHGMYPFVTSSHTTTGGVLNGLGIGPAHVKKIIGVAKALRSHVGGGPFVTKEADPTKAAHIRGKQGAVDSEYGATTGRERQVGYLDLPELRKAVLVNGVTELAITKLDTLPKAGKTIPVAVAYMHNDKRLELAPSSAYQLAACKPVYEHLPTWKQDISTTRTFHDLPNEAQDFVRFLEKALNIPVTMIGVGPYREQVILR